jgi:hypothetical protein
MHEHLNISDELCSICKNLYNNLCNHVFVENDFAYTIDPFSKLSSIHSDLDICNGIHYLIDANVIEDTYLLPLLLNNIIKNQNIDGSWNETYLNYNNPSSLMTSLVGLTLLNCKDSIDDNLLNNTLKKALNYVESQEYIPGQFKKSEYFFADILNVTASVGALFASYGSVFGDNKRLKSAEIAAFNVCRHQYPDGSFPYSSFIRAYPYKYHLDIPSIFYQSIVLFYLIKINEILQIGWLEKSINIGMNWLKSCQRKNGSFNWSKSGFPFPLYTSSTYSLALYVYIVNGENDFSNKTFDYFSSNSVDNYFMKLEQAKTLSVFSEIKTSFDVSIKGNYPFKHKIFRFGHCFLNGIARRRIKDPNNDKLTIALYNISKMKSSTFPKFCNYPDFGMNCEIFHYLASVYNYMAKIN